MADDTAPGPAPQRPAASWSLTAPPWLPDRPVPACRVVVDNDFAGDPDGLFQLAHQLLSPSQSVKAVITSRMVPMTPRVRPGETVETGLRTAADLLDVMHVDAHDLLRRGSERPLAALNDPRPSEGSDAIIEEAMRDDDTPLVVVCGAGLTELASAYLREPRIAERLTAVWIGGPEHPGAPRPPAGALPVEYNVGIDPISARVVLEQSTIPLWQVPRDVYRQCIVSRAELRTRVARTGTVGRHLYESLSRVYDAMAATGRGTGETFVLGDSPLVLLTALQTLFEPETASSRFEHRPAQRFDDTGRAVGADGRTIRVYDHVDVRLLVEDLVAKLTELDAWLDRSGR
ncbi:nucleoside hydrolase [Kineococcus esterisolvens]|uniref:nucleoside hydrolase n=1 Tax=unclassified Kineococcus TaxID=2621656 RepID=UPI003D7DA75A